MGNIKTYQQLMESLEDEIIKKSHSLRKSFERHLGTGVYDSQVEAIVRGFTDEDYYQMAKKTVGKKFKEKMI